MMTRPLKTSLKPPRRALFLREGYSFTPKELQKPSKTPPAVDYRGIFDQKKYAGKEPDPETGLYYYGARYLDPKTSRWLSGDPALGEYFPFAPVNDEAKKRNPNLPGMGGVFNVVNMHAYHYAGNNPVKYVDPDGKDITIRGATVREAINHLYRKSNTFSSSLNILLDKKNNLGQRFVVCFDESEGPYPGYTRTDTDVAEKTVNTFTLAENGEIQRGSIEKGQEVQQVDIIIDMEKIKDRKLNIYRVVTEEVMHAVDAAKMGSLEFNKLVEKEQSTLEYHERPLENSADRRTQIVLDEMAR
jgi:RHS repeat-associated protein